MTFNVYVSIPFFWCDTQKCTEKQGDWNPANNANSLYLHRFGKHSRDLLAAFVVPTAHATLVKLPVWVQLAVTACLDAFPLNTYSWSVGRARRPINHLHVLETTHHAALEGCNPKKVREFNSCTKADHLNTFTNDPKTYLDTRMMHQRERAMTFIG